MATKGDKAVLAPRAKRLYSEGKTLTAIAEELDVSITTLSRWKTADTRPGAECDEWDRARTAKQDNIARLRKLFDEQLSYCESLHPSERGSREMDALAKMGALLERWDKVEKAQAAAREIIEGTGRESEPLTAGRIAQIKEMFGL